MHLDDRRSECAERIREDDARMGEPTRVDDATGAVSALLLEQVDHRALVVGLLAADLEAELPGAARTAASMSARVTDP